MDFLSFAFGIIVGINDFLYRLGIFKKHKVNCFVVSVGNLSVGGTGKTPAIEWLVSWSLKNNLKPGVVARGYGANFKGVKKVHLNTDIFFGDEPEVIAQKFPSVPVYVCSKKYLAAQEISRIENLDILFIDDGFQHKSLHRDLDLLLVDSLSTEKEWALMPKGRLRESIGAAQRADVLLVSRANLVDQNVWPKNLRDVAAEFSKRKKPVVKINFEISGFTSGSEGSKVDEIKNEVVLLSGIGRPRSFELLIATKKKYLKHYAFADHFNYKTADVAQILMDHPNCSIVTTQKDFVKIKKLDLDLKRIFVAELGTTWLGDASAVEEILLKGVQK